MLDVILDVLELAMGSPAQKPLLDLVRQFVTGPAAVCNLLGRKFQVAVSG